MTSKNLPLDSTTKQVTQLPTQGLHPDTPNLISDERLRLDNATSLFSDWTIEYVRATDLCECILLRSSLQPIHCCVQRCTTVPKQWHLRGQ